MYFKNIGVHKPGIAVLLLNNKGVIFTYVGFFVRRPGGLGSKYLIVVFRWVNVSFSNLK